MHRIRRPYSRIRDPRILIASLIAFGIIMVGAWVFVTAYLSATQ